MKKAYYLCYEIAQRYKVKIETVYGWIRKGKLKAVKQGRDYHIAGDDLLEFERGLRYTT